MRNLSIEERILMTLFVVSILLSFALVHAHMDRIEEKINKISGAVQAEPSSEPPGV